MRISRTCLLYAKTIRVLLQLTDPKPIQKYVSSCALATGLDGKVTDAKLINDGGGAAAA